MKSSTLLNIVLIILTFSLVTNCSSKKKENVEIQKTAEEFFGQAEAELAKAEYLKAAEDFAKVYNEHPYSNLAVKAKIMEAFSYYQLQDFDMAIAIIDEFVRFHPGNKDLSYAYYLKAMSYYKQISDIERDQKITELAKNAITEVILKFPDSDYARELKIKLDLINDHLAGKEMDIGRFYIYRGELLAAINRFQLVVDQYQTTAHVKEALYRLVEAYLALGIVEEARKNASVLGYNYPKDKWYKRAYNLLNQYIDANKLTNQ